jgi:hypothetical protein
MVRSQVHVAGGRTGPGLNQRPQNGMFFQTQELHKSCTKGFISLQIVSPGCIPLPRVLIVKP